MGAPEAFTQTTDVAHWIAGAPHHGIGDPSTQRSQTVWNPTTGAAARRVLLATEADVNAAVSAATAAQPSSPSRQFQRRFLRFLLRQRFGALTLGLGRAQGVQPAHMLGGVGTAEVVHQHRVNFHLRRQHAF